MEICFQAWHLCELATDGSLFGFSVYYEFVLERSELRSEPLRNQSLCNSSFKAFSHHGRYAFAGGAIGRCEL